MLTLLLALGGLAPTVLVPAPAPVDGGAHGKFAVHAAHIRTVANEVIDDAVLFVDNGKITRVETLAKAGKLDMTVIEHPGWLSAGLVACRSYAGTEGDSFDSKRSLMPDAHIADAIDLEHPDFARALAAGITSVVVTPSANTLASGISAVVKTHDGRFAQREAHLALGLSQQALRYNRYPTSFGAAVSELDKQFEAGVGVWGRAAKGEMLVLIDVGTRDEIQRALELAGRHKLRGALCRATLAGELADEVKRSGLGVIVGPFDTGTTQRALDSVVALAAQRVPLAFGVDAPWGSDEGLRLSAAMCVRGGLDGAIAWDALTSTAAVLAGVGDKLGKLSRGYDADFVLWSGDPLDLTSRVEAVYVDGAHAFGGDEK